MISSESGGVKGGEFLSSYRIIYALYLGDCWIPSIICCVPTADDGGWKDSRFVWFRTHDLRSFARFLRLMG